MYTIITNRRLGSRMTSWEPLQVQFILIDLLLRPRGNNGSGRNTPWNNRRNDRGQSSQGLLSRNNFDKHIDPAEAPRLAEYNFSVDASGIVSAIERIKDTRWPRPTQTDPSQRNPNLMCGYHSTHGHKTEDCRQLREEVARLLNEGHLR